MDPFLHSIFAGLPKLLHDERGEWTSSIQRDRVSGPIDVHERGLEGDRVAQPYHGSLGAAVCAHLCDHYDFWNERYSLALQPGAVGENFTLANLVEDEVCVGDVVRVGSALLQVSGPRIPCANLARRIGRSDWVKSTVLENRTGFYLRVLRPGTVSEGDRWCVEERWNADGSIPAVNRCMYLEFDAARAADFVAMRGLADAWKTLFVEKLTRNGHWTDEIAR